MQNFEIPDSLDKDFGCKNKSHQAQFNATFDLSKLDVETLLTAATKTWVILAQAMVRDNITSKTGRVTQTFDVMSLSKPVDEKAKANRAWMKLDPDLRAAMIAEETDKRDAEELAKHTPPTTGKKNRK